MAGRNVLQSAESAEPDSAASGLLAEATEAGGIAAWHWDVESGRLAWSANLDAVRLSFPRSSEVTFEVFGSEIHPEDQDRVLADLRAEPRKHRTATRCSAGCHLAPMDRFPGSRREAV
jgi:hypothetical protein